MKTTVFNDGNNVRLTLTAETGMEEVHLKELRVALWKERIKLVDDLVGGFKPFNITLIMEKKE